jgi:uncharacterized membrane protein
MTEPVTFTDPAYLLWDTKLDMARTTKWGNLAIFTVRAVAEQVCAQNPGTKVRAVLIRPVEQH